MEFVKNFEELSEDYLSAAGGKGASLAKMISSGINVPSGFVVLSDSFADFLSKNHLDAEITSTLHSVSHNEIHTINNASKKIQSLIIDAEIPLNIVADIKNSFDALGAKYVAVRSSATAEDSKDAAWAGQLESYLNTTEEKLFENIKKCWASLFSTRAIFYRFEKKMRNIDIKIAVIVQRMLESEKSGIAFSVHPITENKNQLIIEAGFGLGEAIVSGQTTPDSYTIEKQPLQIIDKYTKTHTKGLYRSEKGGNEWRPIPERYNLGQVLTDDEIIKLSKEIINTENIFGFPCDIEWALSQNFFYLLQSRPITTLENKYNA